MTLDLTPEEIKIIAGWYHAAARESMSGAAEDDEPAGRDAARSLLKKLGIERNFMDGGNELAT